MKKHRKRRRARLKRRIRTNSGANSMSGVEASSMADPINTKKEKKKIKSTKPARIVTTVHGF